MNSNERVYHYRRLQKDISIILHTFPCVSCTSIGKSVLGRDIYELRVGSGKRVIHYNASFHANEWITSLVLMKWIYSFLSEHAVTGSQGSSLLREIQLSLVPMVNPDGIELIYKGTDAAEGRFSVEVMNEYKKDYCNWKANIRGVDLNKQFPANWDLNKRNTYCQMPYYRDYPGEAPLTEPESLALYQLVKNCSFEMVLALHTQGKEIYWGYCNYEPEYSKNIATQFEKVSSYKAIQNVESHAGFRDWFISTYHRPGFTIELGKGMNPIPLSQFSEIYTDTAPILKTALLV